MTQEIPKSIIIYRSKGKKGGLEVYLKRGTVWLNQGQIADLFGTQRPAITKHLKNIVKERELKEKSVCSILEHTASDGKIYKTKFYNLDAIISVGYRVNSKRATEFRIWATRVLKKYLVNGYVLNNRKLLQQSKEKIERLHGTVNYLYKKAGAPALQGMEQELFSIIRDYALSLQLLYQYDEKKIVGKGRKKPHYCLSYENSIGIIKQVKGKLVLKKEASDLFGCEVEEKLFGILGSIDQTFGKQELYPTIEEKAAHLLYFIIKDHPFVDGNKRIASILFIYFLDRNNVLFRKNGERKINDTSLTALALLIAISDPKEKETMISLIMNLIA